MHQVVLSRYVLALNESTNGRYPSLTRKTGLIGRRTIKLKYHSITLYGTDVGSYYSIPLEKLDVHRRHSLWVAHTLASFHLGPPLVHRVALFQVALSWVALSHYISTLNENTKDRYPNSIGDPNRKPRPDRWENPSSLSTTPQPYVKPMWDSISEFDEYIKYSSQP